MIILISHGNILACLRSERRPRPLAVTCGEPTTVYDNDLNVAKKYKISMILYIELETILMTIFKEGMKRASVSTSGPKCPNSHVLNLSLSSPNGAGNDGGEATSL